MRIREPTLVIYSVITQECVHLLYNSLAYLTLKKNYSITSLQSEKVRDTHQCHDFLKAWTRFDVQWETKRILMEGIKSPLRNTEFY